MIDSVDWRDLADKLDTITWTDNGWSESGGTGVACEAITEILGDAALGDAVDYYVSGRAGKEMARSVLMLLKPPVAMERCREIFRETSDDQEAADAINLLQMVADRRVFEWIPEFLASENVGVRVWAMGIVDQLLIMQEAIELEEAMPLIEQALGDPSENVQHMGRQILEMLAEHPGEK